MLLPMAIRWRILLLLVETNPKLATNHGAWRSMQFRREENMDSSSSRVNHPQSIKIFTLGDYHRFKTKILRELFELLLLRSLVVDA
jgi:hypothetical protein